MKALILSGGTGTRLRPISYTNAKQLLPLANKPIIVYLIEKVVKAGIHDIGIIVGETQEQVKQTLGNGDQWGVSITYIYQEGSLGLAHAVRTASGFIDGSDFVMILGDNIFSMGLESVIENFYTYRANTAVLLDRVTNPSQYGVAVVNDNEITALCEKPKEYISDLVLTGVYVFDKSIFTAIGRIKPSRRGELEITDAIQNQLTSGGRVTYELVQGWWKDTGTLQDLLEANRLTFDDIENIELPDKDNQGIILDDSLMTGKILTGNNVYLKNSRIIGPVHIDDDAVIIDSTIGPYTAIGKRCQIMGSTIENNIVLNDASIMNVPKKIFGSLIGRNVSLKGSENEVTMLFLGDDTVIEL
ncbi:glucose-1-phosphate thymidylyltransferase [Dehalobacter sp. DCM]|uniref:glucose-1-phosphate thymidylyltransferase n=1 Tax=Dehalobacter sp. DCM TaxID=2907827 RepID=UPI003081E475|nr:glucose-1-phosphate thymidylyltransferase [Dehalobacter sp. DCM]